ncbi:MAG TPA: hypothetical protein VFX53_05165 [Pedococcus sp.]|nr:hypothetical protein [Pedococcus sp.]
MIEIFQDPKNPTQIALVYNEGEGGIFRLDLARIEYGTNTPEVPEDWVTVLTIPEDDDPQEQEEGEATT